LSFFFLFLHYKQYCSLFLTWWNQGAPYAVGLQFCLPLQLYGHMPAVLTVAGAYNNKHPDTQLSSRVDRAGLISAAPWWALIYYRNLESFNSFFTITYKFTGWIINIQDKGSISISMGTSHFWRWWCFCDDGCLFCCYSWGTSYQDNSHLKSFYRCQIQWFA